MFKSLFKLVVVNVFALQRLNHESELILNT